jgi:hypothetical protein
VSIHPRTVVSLTPNCRAASATFTGESALFPVPGCVTRPHTCWLCLSHAEGERRLLETSVLGFTLSCLPPKKNDAHENECVGDYEGHDRNLPKPCRPIRRLLSVMRVQGSLFDSLVKRIRDMFGYYLLSVF